MTSQSFQSWSSSRLLNEPPQQPLLVVISLSACSQRDDSTSGKQNLTASSESGRQLNPFKPLLRLWPNIHLDLSQLPDCKTHQ